MKHLRQYIRQIVLTEAAISTSQLPANVGVMVYEKPLYKEIEICYCLLRADGSIKAKLKSPIHAKRQELEVWGVITINKNHIARNNTYQVGGVWANGGYGPLLYDIAMELASQKANGLVSDRKSVESAAVDVWAYYANIRSSNDVKVFQSDNLSNTLTPQDDDNMDQYIASLIDGNEWPSSPLSKRYTKAPTTLEALGDKVIYI